MKGYSEGSKDADVGFELNVKSREMLDEGQKWRGGGDGVWLYVYVLRLLYLIFFGKKKQLL